MNTKADRPECECRAELQEHEVRSNSGITRKAREKCECRTELREHEVRSNLVLTRNVCREARTCESLPLTSNSAIIYRCVVMYFCTGHGINRIMCVADAERIGA